MQLRIVGVVLVGLFALVCVGTAVVTNNLRAAPTLTPTNVVLPMITARDVLDYLIKAGVPVFNVRDVAVPSDQWDASQGLQFDVQFGNSRGVFIILSYLNPDFAAADAFEAEVDDFYGPWDVFSLSNIVVLSTPETAPSVDREIFSHVTTYLTGGVIPFLPTSTGVFVAAAATDAAGTQAVVALTPQGMATQAAPTIARVVVTVTPGPPTETRPPTLTRTPRPTRTPSPTATETLVPQDTPTLDPSVSPTITLTPNLTETWIAIVTATPDRARAERFVAAAPRFLDPLRLDPRTITTDQYGATLTYLTNEGVQYPVVLWITGRVEDAEQRYQIDTASMSGGQSVNMGDAAILAPPGHPILAELLYQDMVLIIYNPEQVPSTVPPLNLSADYLIRMLQQLFVILPVQE
jgi:hypothetical protein